MKTTDTKGAYQMGALEMLEFVASAARNFRNEYMEEVNPLIDIEQDTLDSIIVGFVNCVADSQYINYALYTQTVDKVYKNILFNSLFWDLLF